MWRCYQSVAGRCRHYSCRLPADGCGRRSRAPQRTTACYPCYAASATGISVPIGWRWPPRQLPTAAAQALPSCAHGGRLGYPKPAARSWSLSPGRTAHLAAAPMAVWPPISLCGRAREQGCGTSSSCEMRYARGTCAAWGPTPGERRASTPRGVRRLRELGAGIRASAGVTNPVTTFRACSPCWAARLRRQGQRG